MNHMQVFDFKVFSLTFEAQPGLERKPCDRNGVDIQTVHAKAAHLALA